MSVGLLACRPVAESQRIKIGQHTFKQNMARYRRRDRLSTTKRPISAGGSLLPGCRLRSAAGVTVVPFLEFLTSSPFPHSDHGGNHLEAAGEPLTRHTVRPESCWWAADPGSDRALTTVTPAANGTTVCTTVSGEQCTRGEPRPAGVRAALLCRGYPSPKSAARQGDLPTAGPGYAACDRRRAALCRRGRR